jgi:uncharacterized protein YcbX
MAAGRVLELWRWPVKSMGGEPLHATRMDPRGVGGDRTHAVEVEHKGAWRPLTAREAPRLLAWRAAYPFAPGAALRPEDPPVATVTGPDGRAWGWGDPRLRHALEADLQRPVRLRRDPRGLQDLERSVLVTTEASANALEAELGTRVDLRRFRPNVHLELDAPPFAERGWEGAALRLENGVVLRFLHPCMRCAIPTRDPDTQEKWPELLRHLDVRHARLFGINARVVRSGRVQRGEAAEVVPWGESAAVHPRR